MGIHMSPKHGVNPMLVVCFFCQKDRGDLALLGRLRGDVEAPRRGVLDYEPCDECKSYMERGIILISVRDGEKGANPYRTGGWVVVTEDFVKRGLEGDALKEVLAKRVVFVPDEVWDTIKLPRGNKEAGDGT